MKKIKYLECKARLIRLSLVVALTGLWVGSGYLVRALCTPDTVAQVTTDWGTTTIIPYMFLALALLIVAFGVIAMVIALVAWIWGG